MMSDVAPALLAIGIKDANEVRALLHLPPIVRRKKRSRPKRYVTGENRIAKMEDVRDATELMIGLCLGGIRSEKIARVANCSPSSVKLRLRVSGVAFPRGKPRP